MVRRHEVPRLCCAALMVLATASSGWAHTADEKAKEKKEPAAKTESAEAPQSTTAPEQAICKPTKSTDQFNTLEDLFAAEGLLSFEMLTGASAPQQTGSQNPDEATVLWRVVQPD